MFELLHGLLLLLGALDAQPVLEARLGKPGANRRLHDTLDRIERSLFSGGDASRRLTSLGPTLLQLLETAWRTGDRAAGFRVAQLSTWGDAGRAVAAAAARESSGPNAASIRKRQDLLAERDRQTEASLRAFGKNVVPHYFVNPAILGGVIVRVGDTVLDGSVRRRLQTLRARMLAQR